MPSDTPPLARTIKGAQEACGLGKTKIYELINRGELAVVKIDNSTLILDEDMLACLKRHREFRGPKGSAPVQRSDTPPETTSPALAAPFAPPPASPRRRRGQPSNAAARSPPK
jgi:hypothetical protein